MKYDKKKSKVDVSFQLHMDAENLEKNKEL